MIPKRTFGSDKISRYISFWEWKGLGVKFSHMKRTKNFPTCSDHMHGGVFSPLRAGILGKKKAGIAFFFFVPPSFFEGPTVVMFKPHPKKGTYSKPWYTSQKFNIGQEKLLYLPNRKVVFEPPIF